MSNPKPGTSTREAPASVPHPGLVLRVGFAGRRELDQTAEKPLDTVIRSILSAIGTVLTTARKSTHAGDGYETPVAPFFGPALPVLRLVTGLCEGGDLIAGAAHLWDDTAAPATADKPHLTKELAAVVPFPVEEYRASRARDSWDAFDRQLAECKWVLELDGKYDKPTATELEAIADPRVRAARESLASHRRSRGYRAQAAILLRHSDVLIAATDPDSEVKPGGTMETVREALYFELPVVFINTRTNAVYLIAPEDDIHSVLAARPMPTSEWKQTLQQWVRHVTVDPDLTAASKDKAHPDVHHTRSKHGESLLKEFFGGPERLLEAQKGMRTRLRQRAWSWWEKRFRTGGAAQSDAPLHPYDVYRSWASTLSAHYSGLYRGAFFWNYVLAIAAVILAALSLTLLATVKSGPVLYGVLVVLGVLKLICVTSISRNTSHANRDRWNDRAVDFRYLAERLRGMYYLPLAGSQQPPAAGPPQFVSRVVRQSAVDWLFEAIVRCVSPADLADATAADLSDPEGQRPQVRVQKLLRLKPLSVAENVRDRWIREQAVYHDRNARTMHNMNHAIEVVSIGFSYTVMFIVALDILLLGGKLLHLFPEAWASSLKVATPWLIFITAILPAIVAALGGIRFQSECQRLAERSNVIRTMLSGWVGHHEAHRERRGPLVWRQFLAYCSDAWHVVRLVSGQAPQPTPMTFEGGRYALANDVVGRIRSAKASPATDIGSWSLEVLRMTERVAEDFVQEAAEWSVLYAKEVSDPG